MEKESKRFEDWVEVDCNECARWWDSSCDGADKQKPCNSFLATRSIILPEQIKKLQEENKRNKWGIVFLCLAMIIHIIDHLIS